MKSFKHTIMLNKKFKNTVSRYISNLKFLFLYQFFIKKVVVKFIDEAHVFCQGESLRYYHNLYEKNKTSKPDIAVLANFEKNNLIDSNLKKDLKNIPLIFVTNITEPVLYFSNIIGIRLYKVFVARFRGNYSHGSYLRTNCRLNKITSEVDYMPKELLSLYLKLIRNGRKSNVGLSSLLIACYYKPKVIRIFGLDFYESEYFDGSLLSDMTVKHKKAVKKNSSLVKKSFLYIVKNFTNINFKIYTKASIEISEKNLEVIRL